MRGNYTNKVSDASRKGYNELKEKYKESGLKEHMDKASGAANDLLEQSGLPKRLSEANDALNNELDSLSGKKVMEKLTAHIALQEQYNDVLAGKLEEALNRIEDLEKKVRGQ